MTSPDHAQKPALGEDEHADALAWLDGLAGRGEAASSASTQSGAELRAALLVETEHPTAMPPDWALIQSLARTHTPAEKIVGQPTGSPANQSHFRPMLAWVASLLLVCGLIWTQWPDEEPDARLRGTGSSAVWLVPAPQAAAETLSEELRARGADVRVSRAGAEWRLSIRATSAATVAAVNERLQSLETGLDAQGRLDLVVRGAKP